jgi:hypothetical protein
MIVDSQEKNTTDLRQSFERTQAICFTLSNWKALYLTTADPDQIPQITKIIECWLICRTSGILIPAQDAASHGACSVAIFQ